MRLILAFLMIAAVSSVRAQTPQITQRLPAPNTTAALTTSTVSITWNVPIQVSTASPTTITIRGSQTPKLYSTNASAFAFSNNNSTLTITPEPAFAVGETITVYVSAVVSGTTGTAMTSSQSWSFVVAPYDSGTRLLDSISTLPLGSSGIYSFESGDYNNDGYPDLIQGVGAALSTALNNQDGTFSLGSNTSNLDAFYGLSAADFNGDDDMDALASTWGSANGIYVYSGNGSGALTLSSSITLSAINRVDNDVADFDGDGDLDFVQTALNSSQIWWYRGNGAGSFQLATTLSATAAAVSAADFNGDGHIDIIAARDEFRYFQNDGYGNFSTPQAPFLLASSTRKLLTGDFDGDADVDVVCVTDYNQANYFIVLENDGSGHFSVSQQSSSSALGLNQPDMKSADFDGDGDLDLLVAFRSSNPNIYLSENVAGTFGPLVSIGTIRPAGDRRIATADFDKDGDIDCAILDGVGTPRIHFLSNTAYVPGSVVNTFNDGPGSLRYALENATSGTVITFAPGLETASYTLTSGPIRIKALLTVDFSGLTINGSGSPALLLECGALGTTIRGAAIVNTPVGRAVISDCSSVRGVFVQKP